MSREISRLTADKVKGKELKRGLHADGAGLYLHVGRSGARSWVFRYMLHGKTHDMGLGALHTVGLVEARKRALDCRRQLLDGVDPLAARLAVRAQARLDKAKAVTFGECAERYVTAHQPGWKNAKHRAQWTATLDTYVNPVFGALPVPSIDVGLVMKVLEPLWSSKPETASRVRGRIEAILDWAATRGYRHGDNPARWRGHLENLLPKRSKVARVEHHAALPFAELPAFIQLLRAQKGIGALALQFAILTAARTGEVIGARWSEVNFAEAIWTVPAGRMKGGREHRVPLSAPAVALLRELHEFHAGDDDFAFPGAKPARGLSNMTLLVLLRRMDRSDLTSHGFRSTFRDWAAERTSFQSEVVEMALAHVVSDKVEAAYRRGDLFEKRRALMGAWAAYCDGNAALGAVVPLHA